MKRAREESCVAGFPCTEIQGTNFFHSSDPRNNLPSLRKRRAADDGEMPPKRRRCRFFTISTEHSDGSAEFMRMKRCKRKASVGAGPSEKKSRCSNDTSTDNSSVDDPTLEINEGKASDDSEAPNNSTSCSYSYSSSSHGSFISVPSLASSENFSCGETSSSHNSFISVPSCVPAENTSCGDSSSSHGSFLPLPSFEEAVIEVKADESSYTISHNFSNTSPEEERIFEMSSSGNMSRADFEDKYCQLAMIGSGGFGSVYEGFRKSDRLPVAIKHITSEAVNLGRVSCNGKVYKIILEVAFMLKAAGLPGSDERSAAVFLLDWYTLDQELILVMERPVSSKDLYWYLRSRGGFLDENEAKMILKQLVDAAIDMHSKGIFHRDIKLQNVLIELDSDAPRVRLIDFGCGSFTSEDAYSSFSGTRAYCPPEWYDCNAYWACPTTIWQLGALFYSLLVGHKPFTTMDYINNNIQINRALSVGTKTLLHMCLARDPLDRATLEELQEHPAFR